MHRAPSALRTVVVLFLAFITPALFAQEWRTLTDEEAAIIAASRLGQDVNVSIELIDDATAVVFDRAVRAALPNNGRGVPPGVARAARDKGNAAAKQHLDKVSKEQDKVQAHLLAKQAKILFRTQRTFNGFGANVPAQKIDEIRAIPGVKAVHLLPVHTIENAGSVQYIRAPQAWTNPTNLRGDGIRIGIIDTGIDYLHSNFGGPGGGYAANNVTVIGDAPNFPGAKVAGGFDFAGNAYNANVATSVPAPDPDPLDCNGHGSHVAGTAAGYGVNGDGTTYTGAYDTTTPFGALRVGPGVAPRAQLYALKVFGCSGSTLLTVSAIEWAVDPNRDGDFSDHLDVINMSLGSSFGTSFDASATATDNAVLAGVIVVTSAGNAGDTHYITSSPGSATRAIATAASQDDLFPTPAASVNAPAAIAGLKAIGLPTGWGVALTATGVTAPVVAADPPEACVALLNGPAVAGKIAFINRGGSGPGGAACGFQLKARFAQEAGAIGVIIGNVATSVSPFSPPGMGATAGIGAVNIPTVSFGLTAANQVRSQLSSGAVNGTLAAGLTTSLPEVSDQVASFSSRGLRRIDHALKPDITAPGLAIFSTANGSGTLGANNQGTSMAAPHVAGMMALLRQLHPDWSVEELKALAMNTATHDLFLNANQAPPRYMAARIGAGRANAERAAAAEVIAMSDAGDGSVSVSFGALEVSTSITAARTIRVVNKGPNPQTFNIALNPLTIMAGSGFSLPDGNSITVAADSSATFRVQLSANAALMKHPLDPTSSLTQANAAGTQLQRAYLSESSANVTLTPSSGSAVIRVPVHAILRPVANMGTTQTAFLFANPTGSYTITPSGTQLLTSATLSLPTEIASFVSAFELQRSSPDEAASTGARNAADIKAVGVSTNFPRNSNFTATGANIYFGIATWGKWTTLTDVEFDIFVDTNRDGTDDFVIFNSAITDAQANRLDVPIASIARLPANTVFGVSSFINGISASIDAVPYNSNVIVLPVRSVDLGLTAASPRFNYRVVSFARGFAGSVDTVSGMSYDLTNPGLAFPVSSVATALGAPTLGLSMYFDLNGSGITVPYDVAKFNANGSQGVLLLHHHNGDGARDQVLPATAPSATSVSVDGASGQYSDVVTLRATVAPGSFFGQTIAGTVQFSVNGAPAGSASVNSAGVATLSHTIGLPQGSYTIAASFTSSNAFFLNGNGSGALSVSREDAVVTASAANPASVQVASAGGNANFSLAAAINEVADGSLGNIAFAAPVTVTLTPVGPGSTISVAATLSVSGTTLTAVANLTNVPVNVYDVSFVIGGGYYAGGGSTVVAVFDPSLGFVTGGGTIIRNGVRANFGINVKYQKNGNAQGSVLYVEHRAGGVLKVKSNNLGSLSIAGNTAIILAKAVVNEVGNHNIRVTVVDNGEPGSTDQFGLSVSNNSGELADVTFAPVTLSGGNIQVPKN